MKTIIRLTLVVAVMVFTFTSCTKEEGFGGKGEINGVVMHDGKTAEGAVVQLAYGATEATTDFDYSTIADANGNFSFGGLTKGDYYVRSTYTNENGFTFKSPGALIKLGTNKGEAEVTLTVE